MFKNLLLVFAVCGLAIASAKTYTVTLAEPYTVSGKQLKPGNYRLSLNGSQAQLLDSRGHRIPVKATVQNEPKKYDHTAVESNQANGAARLQAIELQGTRLKVNFN